MPGKYYKYIPHKTLYMNVYLNRIQSIDGNHCIQVNLSDYEICTMDSVTSDDGKTSIKFTLNEHSKILTLPFYDVEKCKYELCLKFSALEENYFESRKEKKQRLDNNPI